MASVLAELSSWASTLPFWERAALDKIVRGVTFADSVCDELLQYLLEDSGLSETKVQRPALRFSSGTEPMLETTAPLRLVQMSNLQNVNALVPKQTLTFGESLTAVYGSNGSGKSGYARVLGCAGFTRGDSEVLPDVTRPATEAVVLSADIQVADGESIHNIHYKVGERCRELASFYVFDSTSVHVHLTESNALSFSPAGLKYLTQLADVTDRVRDRLKARIGERTQPHTFGGLFEGRSETSDFIKTLDGDTDLNALRDLANVTQEQEKQVASLDLKIAQLKAKDIPAEIAALQQKIDDLQLLVEKLGDAQRKLSDQVVEDIQNTIDACLAQQDIAQQVSVEQFKSRDLTQTGSDAWHQFIRAARSLADAESLPDKRYPAADRVCLLCHQPLSVEAYHLLLRLWTFLESDAQAKLSEERRRLADKRTPLETVSLGVFTDQSVSFRHLREHNAAVLKEVESFIGGCQERLDCLLNGIDSCAVPTNLLPFPRDPIPEIKRTIEGLTASRDALEEQNPSAEIVQLEQELTNLRHRVILHQHLGEIEGFVQQRIWAQKAGRVGGNTRHVTQKHNDLFKELVTDRYVELFAQTLKDLGRPLGVGVVTSGRKGEVFKKISLEAGSSVSSTDRGTPDKVLSEGEKRAVALADFLTEVALDTSSSGIVLDDPVTSLDLEWRERVAGMLAEKARSRQVIVFTHDLPFLYHLKKHAEEQQANILTHWVKRGDNDGRPGYVYLNNSPALEQEYRKPTRAQEIYKEAKDAPAALQEALLREGFGALRTSYEAFIVFDLLAKVVMRFDERISFGRLTDIVWDTSIVEEVVTKCEALSRYIEGHLHSDLFAAQKPTPDMLLREIQAFEALRSRFSKAKKQKKTN